MARCTRYNIMWKGLSVTWDRSVLMSQATLFMGLTEFKLYWEKVWLQFIVNMILSFSVTHSISRCYHNMSYQCWLHYLRWNCFNFSFYNAPYDIAPTLCSITADKMCLIDTCSKIQPDRSWRYYWAILQVNYDQVYLVWLMVFNATFNNISVISWRSVLLVEEIGVPGKNHWNKFGRFLDNDR
jgi:hypothetical protein